MDSRKLPATAHRAFSALARPLMWLTRHPQLDSAPKTAFDAFEQRLERQFACHRPQPNWQAAFREVLSLCADLTPQDCTAAERGLDIRIERVRRRLASDGAGASLLAFLDEANTQHVGAPLLGILDPTTHGLATLSAHARLRDLRGSRGEPRALRLLGAALDVSERVYKPYLQAIGRISNPAQVGASQPSYGRLIEELRPFSARFPGLVLQDAVRIRNALAHSHYEYLPSQRAIALHDLRGWAQTMTVRELGFYTQSMLHMAGTSYPRAASVFLLGAVRPAIKLLPQLARAALEDDRSALASLAPQFVHGFVDPHRRPRPHP